MSAPARYLQQCGDLRFFHGVLHRVQRPADAPPRLVREILAPSATDCQDDDACTTATYDAMKWKSNPAEFIHVIRAHEVAPAPNPGSRGGQSSSSSV